MNKQSESVVNIVKALLEAQKEMENVTKDSKNPFFKSQYADINALREEAIPTLNKQGIIIMQPPATYKGINYIQTTLYHTSGEFLSSLNEVVTKKQNDPQDFLAAQTYTRRGAMQAFLCMGAVDDDGNSVNGRSAKDTKEAKGGFSRKSEVNQAEKEASNDEPTTESKPATRSFRRK